MPFAGAMSAWLVGRKQATGLKVDLELSQVAVGQRDDLKSAVAVNLHSAFQDLHGKLQQGKLHNSTFKSLSFQRVSFIELLCAL